MSAPRSWDVFCRVIDNFGDAAVCWRLARALAALPAAPPVRLWIDEPEVLHALVPGVLDAAAEQTVEGVRVCRLVEAPRFGEPADVAVDGFGGGLPEVYAHAMAQRSPPPLWIVLEYLSAERWISSHHGLPSPHPHLPVERYFFFPGFGPGTGGLLREPGLDRRRAAVLRPEHALAWWRALGFEPPPPGATLVSLFAYENACAAALLSTWTAGPTRVVAAVPASRVSADVARFFGTSHAAPGETQVRGSLEVRHLPFLAQERYDELLWLSDWNFVRGEDSFVRAQWAERPLAWHVYPQAEDAHRAKLEAFLGLYCEGLAPPVADALQRLQRTWNGVPEAAALATAWPRLAGAGVELRAHAAAWARRAASGGDLAMNLARFCADRLK